jgi:hypothetical protein
MNFFKACSIALLISMVTLTAKAADDKSPKFANYPVDSIHTGKSAAVQLTTEEHQMFRTRLRDARNEPISFAGEYAVVTWGCGSGCFMGAAVSHKTGKVHMLPGEGLTSFGKTNWDNTEPLTFRVNSNLMVIYAFRGGEESEDDEGMVHFYSLDNDKGFKFIKSVPQL